MIVAQAQRDKLTQKLEQVRMRGAAKLGTGGDGFGGGRATRHCTAGLTWGGGGQEPISLYCCSNKLPCVLRVNKLSEWPLP